MKFKKNPEQEMLIRSRGILIDVAADLHSDGYPAQAGEAMSSALIVHAMIRQLDKEER